VDQVNVCDPHGVHFTNGSCEVLQGCPTSTTKEDVREGFALRDIAAFIDIEDHAPRVPRFIVAVTAGKHNR
jgi:hypothetical protein